MRRPSGPFGSMPLTANSIARSGCSLQQLAERDALQVADVAGVLVIELVGELGARDAYGAGIDHDDVIAKVLMRRIIRLVLALQAMRDLRGQAAQGFACGVDQEPVAAGFFRLGKYGVHGNTQLFQVVNERRESVQNARAQMPALRPPRRRAYNIMCRMEYSQF